MAHWLKHYEAWQNIWQPASQIWITGSVINACLTLTNTNCCYRHCYSVQRRRYCDEFEMVYVRRSVSGWTVTEPKMKSLYRCQYLSPPTSTHGNYLGTESNLTLFGHIALMADNVDAKQILTSSPSVYWKRPPGRPRMTWMKTVQNDLHFHGLSWTDAVDLIQNRPLCMLLTTSGAMQS